MSEDRAAVSREAGIRGVTDILDTWRRLAHVDGLEITTNLLSGSIAGSVVALLYDPKDARKLQGGVALSVNGLERELGQDDLVATRYYNAMRTLRASQEH